LPFYNHIEEKNLQLIVEIDPMLDINVLVDDVRLIQIFNNLLSNSMKFTEHGYIKLSAECECIDALSLNVNFFVEDSGIGINEEHQSKIFECFGQVYNESSRKYTGTGLGLTICLRLLQLMGSSLQLVSEKQKGSTFSFNLTLSRPDEHIKETDQVVSETGDISGLRILIVEDNQINMVIAKKILNGQHALCDAAYNGKEALELLEKDAVYDMILLDLEMPVMDGYTAILKMKCLHLEIPVIALTASLIDYQKVTELLSIGFEDCIPKPFQPQHLFSQIKKHARKAPEKIS
jgi:CheY-like chemotaxis protein